MRLKLHNGLVYLAQEHPPLTEEELFKKYQGEKTKFLTDAQQKFKDLVPLLHTMGDVAKESASSKKQAKEFFLDEAHSDLNVRRFLNQFGLGQNDAILSRFAELVLKGKSPTTVWNSLRRMLESAFIEKAREKAKAPLREVGLPPEIVKELLPSPFSFEVSPSGRIVREFSVFGNKLRTEEKKTRAMAKLLDQWTELTSQLNQDLESDNPVTRLTAIVASIIVHTGIRPGAGGESKLKDDFGKVVKDDEGKPIRVPTVGATGLKPEHIQFLRDDYARLEFTGKAGTKNVAELSDPNLIRALKAQIALAKKGGSGLASRLLPNTSTSTCSLSLVLVLLQQTFASFEQLKASMMLYGSVKMNWLTNCVA
jgi:hypothetical protein